MRRIAGITGSRSDYGLMSPVFQAIHESGEFDLHLIVTCMHLAPEFTSVLERIKQDAFGELHYVNMLLAEDSGKAMAQSMGLAVFGIAEALAQLQPEIVLLQGDRGEMLAAAIAAAHMNLPIVHMSGGDRSGSIDDSIRNAISKFSHIHLTTCSQSTDRLIAMNEQAQRIFEVGEPGLDVIRCMRFVPGADLARELDLDLSQPIIVGAQHPVTSEAEAAAWQLEQTLKALESVNVQTVFTYPNADAGGRRMIEVLESFRNRPFVRIVSTLGSQKFLSLLKIASVLVGNSSSGILEAPSFKLPAVNIGTRQHGRLRASNVIDVGYDIEEIRAAIDKALGDRAFREALENCTNPYGDGHASERTVRILKMLKPIPPLCTKWIETSEDWLDEAI